MSLRWRLLLAVGAVALAALLTADIATYSSLKNFLYDRVDQSLEATRTPLEREFNEGHGGGPGPGPGPQFAPGTFVQVRDGDDSVAYTNPARFRGGDQY